MHKLVISGHRFFACALQIESIPAQCNTASNDTTIRMQAQIPHRKKVYFYLMCYLFLKLGQLLILVLAMTKLLKNPYDGMGVIRPDSNCLLLYANSVLW